MQISAYFQQIFFSLDYRTLESALKQMPDYLMAAIKVDRVRGLQLMDPLRKVALGRRRDQMKMILHQDITMHFHPVALCALSQIAQKLRPISIIPENLFPSISARHDVVDGTGKLNPRRS